MIPEDFSLSLQSPSVEEFLHLRSKVFAGETDLQMAKLSLQNSLFHVLIRKQGQLIGMGRVIGDGALYFYIQDLVVDPDYQHQGLGDVLMENIEKYLQGAAAKGSTIGLMAAAGKEGFYLRYNYVERSGDPWGKGMSKFV